MQSKVISLSLWFFAISATMSAEQLQPYYLSLKLGGSRGTPSLIEQLETAQIELAAARSKQDLLNQQVGGNEAIDVTQQLQNLTQTINGQATPLEEAVNNLAKLLTGIQGTNLTAQILNLMQELKEDKATNQSLLQKIETINQENNALTTDLTTQILNLTQELKEDKATNQSLLQKIETIKQENDAPTQETPSPITKQRPLIDVQPLPAPNLSTYQQEHLPRKNQIGEEAWKLLGGENKILAAVLSRCIQENLGKTLEVSYLGKKNFKLCINGKNQSQPYIF